jgi:SAM-dependent methyltransferase
VDPQDLRAEQRARWDQVAERWGRRADHLRELSLPVSQWMVESLGLSPGQRVLELAAGPGDTGFLAAQKIAPGTLVTSDGSEAMLEVARARARELAIDNVEFKRLELEWIDLPAASVDAVICRWGLMLCVDPAAAASEIRRVLKPAGRLSVAVWDSSELNPWATMDWQALIELGHMAPPDPSGPGMFALAPASRLRELLENAGFLEVGVDGVELDRSYENIDDYIAETLDLSATFSEVWATLDAAQRSEVMERITSLAAPYRVADGSLRIPGRSLVAAASA